MLVEWGVGVGNLAEGRRGGAQNPLRGASLAHAPGRRAARFGWDNGGWGVGCWYGCQHHTFRVPHAAPDQIAELAGAWCRCAVLCVLW
jgi:hypothetical protein